MLSPHGHAEDHGSNRLISRLSAFPLVHRRILLRTPPNNYPRFLYKYVPPDIPEEWLEDYFINSLFFLSPASGFNDPFDISMKVVMEGTVTQKRRVFTEMLKNVHPKLPKQKREVEVNRVMVDGRSTLENVRAIHNQHIESLGVTCLSTNPRSLLMWSHYGKHHKGIVLQFEIARDPTSFLCAAPMKYSKVYPVLNFLENRSDIIHYALRKFCDWSYEEEWRILRIASAGRYHPFQSHALTAIIAGYKAGNEIFDKLGRVLAKRLEMGMAPVKPYQAKLHDSKYQLIITNQVPQIS
ncbi:MAG: DUF2971 domain-containing protein [Nitrosospira sp.]